MDSRKRLIITSVISIVLVSILMIGSTYSIFNSSDVDEEKNVYHTGSLMVTVVDSGNVAISDSTPLSKQNGVLITPYRITVKNEGTVPYKFNVILDPTPSIFNFPLKLLFISVFCTASEIHTRTSISTLAPANKITSSLIALFVQVSNRFGSKSPTFVIIY